MAVILPFRTVRADFFSGERYIKDNLSARVLLFILQNSRRRDMSYSLQLLYPRAKDEISIRYPISGHYTDNAVGERMIYEVDSAAFFYFAHPEMVSSTISRLKELSIVFFDICSKESFHHEPQLIAKRHDRVRLAENFRPGTPKGNNLTHLVARPKMIRAFPEY